MKTQRRISKGFTRFYIMRLFDHPPANLRYIGKRQAVLPPSATQRSPEID